MARDTSDPLHRLYTLKIAFPSDSHEDHVTLGLSSTTAKLEAAVSQWHELLYDQGRISRRELAAAYVRREFILYARDEPADRCEYFAHVLYPYSTAHRHDLAYVAAAPSGMQDTARTYTGLEPGALPHVRSALTQAADGVLRQVARAWQTVEVDGRAGMAAMSLFGSLVAASSFHIGSPHFIPDPLAALRCAPTEWSSAVKSASSRVVVFHDAVPVKDLLAAFGEDTCPVEMRGESIWGWVVTADEAGVIRPESIACGSAPVDASGFISTRIVGQGDHAFGRALRAVAGLVAFGAWDEPGPPPDLGGKPSSGKWMRRAARTPEGRSAAAHGIRVLRTATT